MVRSRKSKSSKKSGSSGSLVSLPTEVLKLLGYYLNLGPGSWPQSRLGRRSIQKELRSLTSTSKLFYDLFKPDRYHSLLLWGVSKDLEFLTSLLKKEDVLPLIRTLQIGRFDPLKDEFHAPFATFLSRLRSLTTFIYSSDGPIPPSLVQAISNSKRHPFLTNVHLTSALVSIEEFARNRRFSGRPPFSSLKRLTLTEEPCEAFFLPEDSIEEGDTDPGWLKDHPKRRWPFVEHSLLHQVSQLLSRSNSTLEHLELNLYLTFQPQDFGSDETNLHTLFSIPVGPSCSNPGSSHSSQLLFPRLVELVLPAANLGSPFFRKLFRTSPNLRNLQVQHVTLGRKEVSDPVAYGGGSLSRLETLHVSAYSSDLVGPAVGSVWKLIRAPLPSTLRKLHLALKSTDGKLLRYIGGRFVELEDLFLTASTWKCSMEVVTTCFSSLPKLSKLHFNVPPDFASPPSPVPNVEELAAEEFLINSATEILQDLGQFSFLLSSFAHERRCSSPRRVSFRQTSTSTA
ncbi:hypothetical protein BDY24DRAFT_219818 [Mrakia frigida]|uniref:uncharacterized protein n=1 Tax=Mrakia frigida TaxID=29902 RepID=UPI003FCC0082